jgi:hypothetical protein
MEGGNFRRVKTGKRGNLFQKTHRKALPSEIPNSPEKFGPLPTLF